MSRILITGASGFLGGDLARWLEGRYNVVAAWRSRPIEFHRAEAVQFDFRDQAQCAEVLERYSPGHIVHAGAMTSTGECERQPSAAYETNVLGTQALLKAAAALRSPPHFVYISTDLVFDGKKGNYREEDETNSIMAYGRTKLEGEVCVRSYTGVFTILRSALMYGPLNPERSSFLDWMVSGIREGEGVLFDDEFRTPIYVEDLCAIIEAVLAGNQTGTFHCGGGERLSRWQFGLRVAEAFGLPGENVRRGLLSDAQLAAPRPRDVSLDISRARSQLGFYPTPVTQALTDIALSSRA